jgi:hypothetical protein
MRQAITTKYLGPTDKRGARIVATAAAGRKVFHWDHAENTEENHKIAATHYANDLNWNGRLIGGCTHDGHYVFVLILDLADSILIQGK